MRRKKRDAITLAVTAITIAKLTESVKMVKSDCPFAKRLHEKAAANTVKAGQHPVPVWCYFLGASLTAASPLCLRRVT